MDIVARILADEGLQKLINLGIELGVINRAGGPGTALLGSDAGLTECPDTGKID